AWCWWSRGSPSPGIATRRRWCPPACWWPPGRSSTGSSPPEAGSRGGDGAGRRRGPRDEPRPGRPIGGGAAERPAVAVVAAEEGLGLGGVGGAHGVGVPLDLAADAVGDVAQVVGLGQPAGVLEVRARRLAGLAGVDPLGVVALGAGEGGFGRREALELLLGQEDVLAVVGEDHAVVADEQHAVVPLGDLAVRPGLGLGGALMPGEPD